MLELYVDKHTLSPTQKKLYKLIKECYSPSTEYIVFQLKNSDKKGDYITPNELKTGIYQGIKDYIYYYIYPLSKRKSIQPNVIKKFFDYTCIIEYPQDSEDLNTHIHCFIKPKVEVGIIELIGLMKDRITLEGRKRNDLVDEVFHTNLYDYSYSDEFINYHCKSMKNNFIEENILTNITYSL